MIRIREGEAKDAPFLAQVVMEAVGEDLCLGLADRAERLPLVSKLFETLAGSDDSQYSYRNAFVAEDEDGNPQGGIIAYDGAQLHELRKAFIREANRILGWNVTEQEAENWGDEADAGETYIDSLYVAPGLRRQGVATRLMDAINRRYENSGKPLGLLVEPENHTALATYRKWGFREVGISNFFYTPMLHLQL